MSQSELLEWEAFFKLEQPTEHRADWRIGMLAQAIIQALGAKADTNIVRQFLWDDRPEEEKLAEQHNRHLDWLERQAAR